MEAGNPGTKQSQTRDRSSWQMSHYSGWYAGSDLLKAVISDNETMILTSTASGRDVSQTYQYEGNGVFSSTNGDYISSTGELTRGSNGQIGRTELEFKELGDGTVYLMAQIYETYPGLGSTASYLPVGEKVVSEEPSEAVLAAWEDISGKEYYMVSDKYTSTAWLKRFRIKPFLPEETKGILSFQNLDLKMAALTSPDTASFFSKVPGQAGRDLNDYSIVRRNGKEYLSSGSYLFLSEENAEPLPTENSTFIIGEEKEAIWFTSSQENQKARVVLEIEEGKRAAGAWYLYDHTGRKMKCISSSWTLDQGQPFYLPGDGRLAFVGEPGTKMYLYYVD